MHKKLREGEKKLFFSLWFRWLRGGGGKEKGKLVSSNSLSRSSSTPKSFYRIYLSFLLRPVLRFFILVGKLAMVNKRQLTSRPIDDLTTTPTSKFGIQFSSGSTRLAALALVAALSIWLPSTCQAVKEVATNHFYVKVKAESVDGQDPKDVAHKIARRNGFHSLGPVSKLLS